MKKTILVVLMALFFVSIWCCISCVEVQQQPNSLDRYKHQFSQVEDAEKALVKYITARTVRVIIRAKIINTKTGKIFKKEYDAGWGTGTIIHSFAGGSYIQTAHHVVVNEDVTRGDLVRKCIGFAIERRDIHNRIINRIDGKITVIAKDKDSDLALIKVPFNFRLTTRIARSVYLGQDVRIIGFPTLPGFKKQHISYERGYIGTCNTGKDGWITNQVRYAAAGYFGNSGGAVFNQQGEVVGTVVSLSGARTLLGHFIPLQNKLYGPGPKALRAFYIKNKLRILLR